MRSEGVLPPLDLIFLMTARAICLRETVDLNSYGQIDNPRALALRPIEDFDLDRTFTLYDLMTAAVAIMSSSWLERWPSTPRLAIEAAISRLLTEGRLETFDRAPWSGKDHEQLRLVHREPSTRDAA